VRADLFVSIHADSFVRSNARGSSVFALSDRRATSELARKLAKQQNESDLIAGVNLKGKEDHLKRTLLDLSQSSSIDYSLRLGNMVLARLGSVNTLHKGRVEQASFAVLTAQDVPSILVETAFISNPDEEKRLNDAAYQERLARAILDGIKDYFAKNPPRPASPLALR
jgi:N-acetylmuramoyl-L-alanine amidase